MFGVAVILIVAAALVSSRALLAASETWTQQTSSTTEVLTAIDCNNNNYCIATGSNGTVRYSSNGTTWNSGVFSTTKNINGVAMADDSFTAYATGEAGTLKKSVDRGATWSTIYPGITTDYHDIYFSDVDTGWAVGQGGTIIHTEDGGDTTWTAQSSGTSLELFHVFFQADGQTGWTVGQSGTLLRSTDGGTSWSSVSSGTSEHLLALDFPSGSVGFVAGTGRTLLRTMNGGNSWTPITIDELDPTDIILDIDFFSASVGAMVTTEGVLLTSDGGSNWTLSPTGSSAILAAIAYRTESTDLWVVGSAGTIMRYDVEGPAAPTSISASSPTTDTTPQFTWDAAIDEVSTVTSYEIAIDDGPYFNIGNITSYISSTLPEGTHTLHVRAMDDIGNVGPSGDSNAVIVDVSPPTIPAPTPSSGGVGEVLPFSSNPWDAAGISSCNLLIDDVSVGSMVLPSPVTLNYSFSSVGTYTAKVQCVDVLGQSATSTGTTITISAETPEPEPDPDPEPDPAPDPDPDPDPTNTVPSVVTSSASAIPSSVVADNVSVSTITVTVRNSDNELLPNKTVALSSNRPGSDSVEALSSTTNDFGQVNFTVRSNAAGTSAVTAVADSMTIATTNVFFTTFTPPPADEPTEGELIKLACPDGAGVNHICKAVYYHSTDGLRHAFPNEKVFFTWYSGFDNVIIVSSAEMAAIPLSKNVTYRPGVRMVKFISVNTVYTVSQGGVLRPIASEAIAEALYGEKWNQHIDDISDAFFGNYTFSSAVNSTSDYSPSEALTSTLLIDDNF